MRMSSDTLYFFLALNLAFVELVVSLANTRQQQMAAF